MRPCRTLTEVKRQCLTYAIMLVVVCDLIGAPILFAKIVNVFPAQPLMAVGRSDVSGAASVQRCNERFADLLQSKIDACIAAGGNCYCRDSEAYPLYKKYYPARQPYTGVWVTSRRVTFRCRKATAPNTCAPCIHVR